MVMTFYDHVRCGHNVNKIIGNHITKTEQMFFKKINSLVRTFTN